jgi:hypothetical protein
MNNWRNSETPRAGLTVPWPASRIHATKVHRTRGAHRNSPRPLPEEFTVRTVLADSLDSLDRYRHAPESDLEALL